MSSTPTEARAPSLLDRILALLRHGGFAAPARLKRASIRAPRAYGRDAIVTFAIAAALLLSIPLSTAIGAWLLAAANERRSEAMAQKAALRLTAAREAAEIERARPEIARLFARRTISEIVERMARALPPEARIHMLSREADGAILAEIDIVDPDLLRPALASDPLLKSLQQVGQRSVPDGGIRVSLRSEAL